MDRLLSEKAVIDTIDQVIAIGDEQLIGFRDDTAAMLAWQLKKDAMNVIKYRIKELPSVEPQITYQYCEKALMKLWDNGIIFFYEYDRIMDRLKKKMEVDHED